MNELIVLKNHKSIDKNNKNNNKKTRTIIKVRNPNYLFVVLKTNKIINNNKCLNVELPFLVKSVNNWSFFIAVMCLVLFVIIL